MRRIHVVLATLVALAGTPAWAQTFFGSVLRQPAVTATPDDLVARMLTFDRDHDGRVTVDELSERMRPFAERGDANGDRALDANELRALAIVPTKSGQVRGFPISLGGYGFADDVGLSSRSHVEGAFEDLGLAEATRDRALPVVQAFLDSWEAASKAKSKAALVREMETWLTKEQLGEFSRTLDTMPGDRGFARATVRVVSSPETSSADEGRVRERLMDAVVSTRIEVQLKKFALTPEQAKQARATLGAPAMSDADRTALLAQLTGILSDEERDDLRAALERRPVVKAGSRGATATHFTFSVGKTF